MKQIHQHVILALFCQASLSSALETSTTQCKLLSAFDANSKKPILNDEVLTADSLAKFKRTVQEQVNKLMTSPEGKAEVFSKATSLIESFRKNSSSSLWPNSLSRERPVALREYFLAMVGEGNDSTHYARTLRNFWFGRQQLIEMVLPSTSQETMEDFKKFKEAVELSHIFEAAAIYHGVSKTQLLGDGP